MKNNLCEYEKQKWIVSVSGGPDSMALLDMTVKSKLEVIALHVNYHKRESAVRDQEFVQNYCVKHNITCYIFDAQDFKGNFQDEARRYRYNKIKDVIHKENARGVLVAHHKDDDLETLLFQITRKSKVNYYGLSLSTQLFGIRVDRPLLDYTKEDLLDYCRDNNIAYGVDETNLSLVYTRNKIRKVLSTLNSNEIQELFKIKEEYNRKRSDFMIENKDLLNQTSLSHNAYISLSHNKHSFLLEWVRFHIGLYPLSDKFIQELDRQLVNSKSVKLRLNEKYRIIKQYGMISLVKDDEDYSYQLELYESIDEIVKLRYDKIGAYIKVLIPKTSFPITIANLRAVRNQLQAYTYTKLSRWFIKNKIPVQEREMWPLVFSKQNELLYILEVGYFHSVSTDIVECYMIK